MSYTCLLYHIVFRPKYRTEAITIAHEACLYRYIGGFVRNKKGVLYRIGGMPDHIHLLVQLPPTMSLADFMRDLKTAAHWFLRKKPEKFPLFTGWGKSYCALSCSLSGKDRVIDYIKNQKIHHQRINFQDELRAMLHIQGIAYEEDSLWKD